MEFMQLKMFRMVANERSVQRAARRVLRSQPAVSMALKKLEQEVGIHLFDPKDRRSYALTPAGKLLYAFAMRLEQLESETQEALKELTGNGELRETPNHTLTASLSA